MTRIEKILSSGVIKAKLTRISLTTLRTLDSSHLEE